MAKWIMVLIINYTKSSHHHISIWDILTLSLMVIVDPSVFFLKISRGYYIMRMGLWLGDILVLSFKAFLVRVV